MESSLHVETPLIQSPSLSAILNRDVFLKLENLQPGGSFKIRGIGHTMQEAVRSGAREFVGSSGGNAGMAMAVAAKKIGKPLTLFIPKSTLPLMIEKLKAEKVEVTVTGNNWNEANAAAEEAVRTREGVFMVHPFGQETTWAGHSSLVTELRTQMTGDKVPGCLVTCVGGGGLALGLLQGLDTCLTWRHVPLVAMETHGANCLSEARRAGAGVTLEAITSAATSLGALRVADTLLERCLEQPDRVISLEVSDKEAKAACVRFADNHRMLVEIACGSVLASVYSGLLGQVLQEKGVEQGVPVILVVCGGNIVNTSLLEQWRRETAE